MSEIFEQIVAASSYDVNVFNNNNTQITAGKAMLSTASLALTIMVDNVCKY